MLDDEVSIFAIIVCQAWHSFSRSQTDHGLLPPSVANHKLLLVMVMMKEVV